MKKIISVVLTIFLVIFVFPVHTIAAGNPVDIDLENITDGTTGVGYSYSAGVLTISSGGPYMITTNGNTVMARSIVVGSGIHSDITIQNLEIDNSSTVGACAFDMTGATVNLTVLDTNLLKSSNQKAGLQVPVGSSLTITDGSTGALDAIGGYGGAGIGTNHNTAIGSVIINGGTILAQGQDYDAGIGGQTDANSKVVINGGNVTAISGGNGGAGIGGSEGFGCQAIAINGGIVAAAGGPNGAGIGSAGVANQGADILITGGDVTATGGQYAAGIGARYQAANITITGGTVTATGGTQGAGIGGGQSYNGGLVKISGSSTRVTATGIDGGKDIGSGWGGNAGGSLQVWNGPVVTLNANGTDADPLILSGCTIQGNGAGSDSGSYAAISIGCTNKTYNGSAFDLEATSEDGVTLSYRYQGRGSTAYADTDTAPKNVGTYTATVNTTANGSYLASKKIVDFEIVKASPSYVAPSGLTAAYGDTLADLSLPSGFSWESPETTPVGSVGNHDFTVIYTPADTSNYNSVMGIPVKVNVIKTTDTETEYVAHSITDSATGVTISGDIALHAELVVTEMELKEKGTDPACDEIRARLEGSDSILAFGRNISLTAGYSGKLTVTIPVGTQYNGQTLEILHCHNGTLETLTGVVSDGKITFSVNDLSPFAVFVRKAENAIASNPLCGNGKSSINWWMSLDFICAAVILISILLMGIKRRSDIKDR